MSSRYDELERLQRLRDGGALTDDEFQAEKARILGVATPPPDEPAAAPEETHGAQGAPSRRPLYWALGVAALILAVVAGLLLGRMVGTSSDGGAENVVALPEGNLADGNLIAPPPPADVRTLPPEEQLARAFEAAFGAPDSAVLRVDAGKDYQTDSFVEQVRYEPGRLIWAPFGALLLSEGEVEDAAHVSAGKVAIHYLRPQGDRFEVVRSYPSGVVSGSSGKIGDWSVSSRFSNWPVVVAEGGGTWQGYSCSVLTLTELRPEGPAELAAIPFSYDDAGAKEDEAEIVSIEGKIGAIVKDRSFEVAYSGSRDFTERYVRRGNRYEIEGGKSEMKTC